MWRTPQALPAKTVRSAQVIANTRLSLGPRPTSISMTTTHRYAREGCESGALLDRVEGDAVGWVDLANLAVKDPESDIAAGKGGESGPLGVAPVVEVGGIDVPILGLDHEVDCVDGV